MRTGRPRKQPLICVVNNCEHPATRKSMCRLHYNRVRMNGSVNCSDQRKLPHEVRFWLSVNKQGPIHPTLGDRCWVWTANGESKYGAISVDGTIQYVHRYSYQLHVGAIENGMEVCHTCDNTRCVNPAHLFLGTNLDNVNDKVSKGRQVKGEDCNLSVLTEKQVLEIRRRSRSWHPIDGRKPLAIEFGVEPSTIWKIVTRRTWKHL